MNRKLFIICLCAGVFSIVHGQSVLGMTFPFGVPVQPNSGMSLSMGGVGTALSSDYNMMLKNPANLATLDRTVLSALYGFEVLNIVDGDMHANRASGAPSQISLGIPLGFLGAFAVSYDQRYNQAATAFFKDDQILYKGLNATYTKGIIQTGGGIAWQIGYGRTIGKWAQIGLSYERSYYTTDHIRVESFAYNSSVENPSRDSTRTTCALNGIRGGLLIPLNKLKIGISGEYFFTSTAKADSGTYYSSINYTSSTIFGSSLVPGSAGVKEFNLRFPPSLALGVAYDFSPEWLAASDVSFTMWDKAYSAIDLGFASTAVNVGLGAQFIPAPNLLSPKYWETMRYRAGIRYTQLPDKDAYEAMLCLGTGLPLGGGSGMFDLGVEVGRRVNSRFPSLTENVVHIDLGFNGGRKWSKSSRGNY